MLVDIETACGEIRSRDNILILTHQKPDGDTLGAAFALMWALFAIGKRARVFCADGFPARYGFICGGYVPDEFEPEYTIAVDVASIKLVSDAPAQYPGKVDLCIDHHKSNSMFAEKTVLDASAAAASQIIIDVIDCLQVPFDSRMATAVFTGISTDTGCFKYSNVTTKTHLAAARMIEAGAEHAKVTKLMFDTRTRGMLMVDRLMIDTTAFFEGGRVALSMLPADICERYGVSEDELDGTSSFPAKIAGVYAGITLRAKPNGTYRVSVRSVSPVDSSRICEIFGGGGHTNAAGCTMAGSLEDVKPRIITAAAEELNRHELA